MNRLMEKSPGSSPVVRMARQALVDLRAHAREELPNECCGLLVGTRDHVVRSVRAPNLRASPTRYLVDPKTHFDAIRSARAEGLAVIGAYHSHPATAPMPSTTDAAEAHEPDYLYVIVSPGRGRTGDAVAGFRRAQAGFERVDLVSCD